MHKMYGYTEPISHHIVQSALKGAARLRPSHDARLPITLPILISLVNILDHIIITQHDKTMFKAMFTLSFHPLLRAGEITKSPHNLQLQDVQFFVSDYNNIGSNDFMIVSFRSYKHSKATEILPKVKIMAELTSSCCPWRALVLYIKHRGTLPGPLFAKNGSPINRTQYVKTITDAVEAVGLPASAFKSHSFRIGGATHAAELGMEPSLIQILGRWKSQAFMRYIRQPNITLA